MTRVSMLKPQLGHCLLVYSSDFVVFIDGDDDDDDDDDDDAMFSWYDDCSDDFDAI